MPGWRICLAYRLAPAALFMVLAGGAFAAIWGAGAM
jgi:hypothetical protein